ncbi:hypothetical protein A1O1_02765 [Capronia coronata CBS 617.96]|uniref:Uncharacterized protein n=1 Tax=Capronia coronata CBS 617.96 TaxID=1182541 RepID=W9YYN2_9EURO|nr:uncharacterized protein A1O1_02765 [Capronia coronata CBS 617.96]EXJ94371.1 hypothetical protein A1O1_02765 [Capronia coronata CBS 617.96]
MTTHLSSERPTSGATGSSPEIWDKVLTGESQPACEASKRDQTLSRVSRRAGNSLKGLGLRSRSLELCTQSMTTNEDLWAHEYTSEDLFSPSPLSYFTADSLFISSQEDHIGQDRPSIEYDAYASYVEEFQIPVQSFYPTTSVSIFQPQSSWNVDAGEFVPGRQEQPPTDLAPATNTHEKTHSDSNMRLSITAPDFVPGNQEHLAAMSEFTGAHFSASVIDEPPLSVLDAMTGDFIAITPSSCLFDFEANDQFDAEYAFNMARGACFRQEQEEGSSLYPHGFYFPTSDNRSDAAPEVFCSVRCLDRFPIIPSPRQETPAEWTQNNRQDFLLWRFEKWSNYEEYSIEEMVGECVHHFSFFNDPVYHKSATKPATTIAVLKSSPKHFAMTDGRNLRIPITVSWASRFLDPVRYTGNPAVLDALRGTKLENAVIGHCDKLYTGNGWWLYDEWSRQEEQPLLDPLNRSKYLKGHTIINGCTRGFPTSREIISAGTEEKLAIDKARKAALQSRLARGPTKSSLGRSCVSSDELEEVPVFIPTQEQPSSIDQQPANTARDNGRSVAAPVAVAAVPLSREKFHRRLAAIPLPSGGDWADDDDEEEEQEAPFESFMAEREAFNRRLEALGPVGSSNWADDIDDEDEDNSLSSATAGISEVALPINVAASASAPSVSALASEQTAAPSVPNMMELSAAEEQPLCRAGTEASNSEREEFNRRLEALGSLGSANWADDIDEEEEGEPSLTWYVQSGTSETGTETTSPTTPSAGVTETSSSATSVASPEHDEAKVPNAPKQNHAEDEEEIVGTVVEANGASWNSLGDSQNELRQPICEAAAEVPAAAETRAEAMPEATRTMLVEAESRHKQPAARMPATTAQIPPESALSSPGWYMAEAAIYWPAFGAGYDQWPDFSGISSFPTSTLAMAKSMPAANVRAALDVPKFKSRGLLKMGLSKIKGLFIGKS